MKRVASVIGIAKENLGTYAEYHADVWPGVLETLVKCNIRNYSIFVFGELLFSYFEYTGENYEEDMLKMAADPITQEWWKLQKPLQIPVNEKATDEWWHELTELFHLD